MKIFQDVPKSRKLIGKDGKEYRFPTRTDYTSYLVRQGHITSPSDLADQPRLVEEIQSHWFTLSQVGCVFAMHMSKDRLSHGWRTVVVSEPEDRCIEPEVVDNLEQKIDWGVSDENVRALSIIYSSVTSPEYMIGVIKSLLDLERFNATECEPLVTTERVVPLKIKMSLAPKKIQAEPLCFGPFEFFAQTRQAPFFEIAIPLVEKRLPPRHPALDTDKKRSNLADIKINIEANLWNKWMIATTKLKKTILGRSNDHEVGAKAEISLSVPERFWKS